MSLGPTMDIARIARRFSCDEDLVQEVLTPLRFPILAFERQPRRDPDAGWISMASFDVRSHRWPLAPGRSGKVVPQAYYTGTAPWRELLKARVHSADGGIATAELHAGSQSGKDLARRLAEVSIGDVLEIDPYGITSKLESALTEAALVRQLESEGFTAVRQPDDIAKHIQKTLPEGQKFSCDFRVSRDGRVWKRLEAKSLWGTDATKARLIHSRTKGWETSSCRFADQDFFAVNLWLRTGHVSDIVFARSVLRDRDHPYGLPAAREKRGRGPLLPDYVTQNPPIPEEGVWFARLTDIWELP